MQGIGEGTEKKLWEQGICSWEDLETSASEVLGPKKLAMCMVELEESRAALEAGEIKFFSTRLGSQNAWRLIPHCEDSIAYLDIESTGMGFPPMASSTAVAVSFRGELFVEHDKAKKRKLFEMLHEEAKMWVTFNGLSFDLPFLRRELKMPFDQAHVDLRVWLRRHGLKGGLKKIQQALPGIPKRDSMDIDGFDAVRLWRMHERGVPGALETLMSYNAEDTVVLEDLVAHAWTEESQRWPTLKFPRRAKPSPPKIPYKVHASVYEMLRG
jgi:uncharacterized protein